MRYLSCPWRSCGVRSSAIRWRGGSYISVLRLEKEPLVLFQNSFSLCELATDRFKTAGITPNILHSTGQLSTLESLIRSGTASGFFLKPLADHMPELVSLLLSPPAFAQFSLA